MLCVNALAGVPDETLKQLDLSRLPAVLAAWRERQECNDHECLVGTREVAAREQRLWLTVFALCTPPKTEKENDNEG
jgi:hypothetical protein